MKTTNGIKASILSVLIVVSVFEVTIGSKFIANLAYASLSYIPAPPAASVDTAFFTVLDAATGTGTEVALGGANQVAVECEASSGVTAGVVVLEHSAVSGYAGTWAPLDSKDFSIAPLGSATKSFFTYPGPLGFIRPRITTTFSGGATPKVTVRIKRMFGQ